MFNKSNSNYKKVCIQLKPSLAQISSPQKYLDMELPYYITSFLIIVILVLDFSSSLYKLGLIKGGTVDKCILLFCKIMLGI